MFVWRNTNELGLDRAHLDATQIRACPSAGFDLLTTEFTAVVESSFANDAADLLRIFFLAD